MSLVPETALVRAGVAVLLAAALIVALVDPRPPQLATVGADVLAQAAR
jgi:hypothetical protein